MKYKVKDLYMFSELSIKFEFYNDSDKLDVYKEINKVLSKYSFGENFTLSKLYTNFGKYSLKTPFFPTYISLNLINDMFEWITNKCQLKFDTNMEIDLRFGDKIQTLTRISNINLSRFILGFNENIIWELFPNRKDNCKCVSIKNYKAYNLLNSSDPNNITLFNDTSYYGISFEKILQDILTLNYIGGEIYAFDFNNVKEIIEYFIYFTYYCLNEPISDKEKDIISKYKNKYFEYNKYFLNYSNFKKQFKDFYILIDLIENEQTISIYWPTIKQSLFDIFFNNKELKKGSFNLDTNINELQLKDIKINNCILNNFTILDSTLNNCILQKPTLVNVETYGCVNLDGFMPNYNKSHNDYLNQALINSDNTFEQCVIKDAQRFESKANDCLIINSYINSTAKIENSIVVKRKEEQI